MITDRRKQQISDYIHTTPWIHERLPGLESASLALNQANGRHQETRDEIARFISSHFKMTLDSVSCELTSVRGKGPVVTVHGADNVSKLIASGVPMVPATLFANRTTTLHLA